jgi:hypothetical protein
VIDQKQARREFAAEVRGTSADAVSFRKYVLAEMRCALMRARLYANEIERIGIALKGGIVGPESAMVMMAEAGALGFL